MEGGHLITCSEEAHSHLEVYDDALIPRVFVSVKQAADLQRVGREVTCPEPLQVIPGYRKQTPSIFGIPLTCSSAIRPAASLPKL